MSAKQITNILNRRFKYQQEIATLKAMTDVEVRATWDAMADVEIPIDQVWLELVYSELTVRHIPAFGKYPQ